MTYVKKPRELWVDVAKGMAIALVVLFHTQQLLRDAGMPVDEFWRTVGDTFASVRMPAFFVISGFFLHRWSNRGWPAFLRGKVQNFVYLYIVWALIYFIVDSFIVMQMDERVQTLIRSDPHAHLIRINTPLWYLLALPLFATLWYVTRRLPAWIPLSVTAVGYVATQWGLVMLPEELSTVGFIGFIHYAFAFMLGARLSEPIRGLMRGAGVPHLIIFAAAWVTLLIVQPPIPGLQFFVSVPTLFLVAKVVSQSPRLSRPFLLIGKRSLPIYVTHWLLLEIQIGITYAIVGLPGPETALITTVLFTVSSIFLACVFWRFTRHTKAIWGTAHLPRPEFTEVASLARERVAVS